MSRNQQGFTLIEIMIAIAIMSALTVFTAKSIQDALRNSAKYRRQINESSELRDVLRVMEKDINLAFHHRNIQQEILEEINKEKNKGQEEQQSRFSSASDKEAPNYTQFKGEGSSLHFTSLNNVRTISDIKESDQSEIGYFVQNCHKRGNPKVNFPCLWRRTSPIIDEEVDRGGVAVPILENVKSVELRYIGDKGDELSADPQWQNSWDSASGDNTSGKFPNAVEIKITVNRQMGEKVVPQSLSTVAALRFPNNPKPKSEADEKAETQSN